MSFESQKILGFGILSLVLDDKYMGDLHAAVRGRPSHCASLWGFSSLGGRSRPWIGDLETSPWAPQHCVDLCSSLQSACSLSRLQAHMPIPLSLLPEPLSKVILRMGVFSQGLYLLSKSKLWQCRFPSAPKGFFLSGPNLFQQIKNAGFQNNHFWYKMQELTLEVKSAHQILLLKKVFPKTNTHIYSCLVYDSTAIKRGGRSSHKSCWKS